MTVRSSDCIVKTHNQMTWSQRENAPLANSPTQIMKLVQTMAEGQNNAWQEREEPEHPASMGEDPLAQRRTSPLSSEGIWDWLADPERNVEAAHPDVINLLWARDRERWETWEQQRRPASILDITFMVLDYLRADMRGDSPSLASGEVPLLSSA
ncbi:UNVERIFIED_CONTAM: hypothetical protein FKN15_074810 [Acipenser sinensis]